MSLLPSFFDHLEDHLNLAVFDINQEYRMGIAEVRNAFIDELQDGWRIADCEVHTLQDGTNSQQLVVTGFDKSGNPFSLDSGPVNPMTNMVSKAREMARSLSTATVQSSASLLPPITVATQGTGMTTPGSFAASIRAMMDEARAGVAQARADGLAKVKDAVGQMNDAKAATTQVADSMAKTIKDETASILSELGQISNMPPSD